jgi:hypothetical protein
MALLPDDTAYPTVDIAGIVAFLRDVEATFESNPAARDEFFALVAGFGEGRGNAGAVAARAEEILGGRPRVLAQFRACLAAPDQDPATTARPRRSSRRRPKAERDVSDGDADVVYDEREEKISRRGREQASRATKRAAAVARREEEEDDERAAAGSPEEEDAEGRGRLPGAVAFLKHVKRVVRRGVYLNLLEVLRAAARDNGAMPADAIFCRLRAVLGPANHGLLQSIAAKYLPGKAEWEEQEAARTKKRGCADDEASVATGKKPRAAADGGGVTVSRHAGKAAARQGREDARSRALWEFATGYSTLTSTVSRTEAMIAVLGDGVVGTCSLDLDTLFPSRDSRQLLARLYGAQWPQMRRAIEDGAVAGRALRVVLDSLRWAEEAAVNEAMRCRDRARAAQRLNVLVKNNLDEERRRSSTARGGPSA